MHRPILTYSIIKSKGSVKKSGFKFYHTNNDIVSPPGDNLTEHFYIMTKDDYHAIHII